MFLALDRCDKGEKGWHLLRGIGPQISPDLLHVLASMGHGDELAVVDANFPAASVAHALVRADGLAATDLVQAILSLMPLDTYAEDGAAFSMEVVGKPDETPPIVSSFQSIIDTTADHPSGIVPIERHAFYARAKSAFAIVATGETHLYGNLILKKGVVPPGDENGN